MAETPRCYLPATGGGFAGSDLFKNVSKLGLDGEIDDGEDVGLLVHGTAPCRLPAPIRRPAHYEPIEGAPQMDGDSNPHDIKRWLKRQRRFFRGRAEQSRASFKRRQITRPGQRLPQDQPGERRGGRDRELLRAESLEVALTYGYYQPEEWPSA